MDSRTLPANPSLRMSRPNMKYQAFNSVQGHDVKSRKRDSGLGAGYKILEAWRFEVSML
jgi:hypothetical protein